VQTHSRRIPRTLQTALAERLAQLVVDLSPRVALSFFQGFVQTMKREWSGIDQHRMNKYLVLVRKFYAASLSRLEHAKWDPAVVSQFMSVLRDDVILMPTANDLGAGFAYFVCDIAVEEMVKAAEAAGAGKRRLAGETVLALLEPFVEGLVATKNKVLLMRLYSAVFSEVARHVDEQVTPFDSVDGVGFAEALFERGAC
jgi:ribosomal RNA-processing protein 1